MMKYMLHSILSEQGYLNNSKGGFFLRILAISDIHGQSHVLDKLFKAANYEPSIDKLFFVGTI